MRILITTFGSRGDLDPYLALGRGLAARGHEPTIATHERFKATIEAQGIGFWPVRPHPDPDTQETFARAMSPRTGPQVVLREIVLPHLRDSYIDTSEAARDTDLIVTHPLTFAGPIVAAKQGLPWVSTVLAPLSFFSRYDLPVLAPAPRAWRVYGVPGVPSLMIRLFHLITRSWTEPIRELRQELGLPPGANPLLEGQHSPLLALGLFSRVLARPQSDWPPSAKLTGFLFRDAPSDNPRAVQLETFLDAGAAPIVFTLGSSAVVVAGSFFEESLLAARQLGKRAVLLTGEDPANRPTTALGDDAIAIEEAPHHVIFPRAAAIVHHGGIGTLGQALRAGRPMLVVPWSHDQPDNAHRAARLKVARVLYPPRRYKAARAARALKALLDDPACAASAARIGESVRSEDGVAAACDAIEEAALRQQ